MADRARGAKLADRIKVIVAETLEMRVKDPRLGFVTITDARVTGDLREATVLYTVLGDDAEHAATAAALDSVRGLLRSEVGRRTGVKFTPTLAFVADAVPDNARHIDDLLRSAREQDASVARGAVGATFAGDADPYRLDATAEASDEASEQGLSVPDGLLLVDKPAGPTSHDVVARVRRLAGTRKVGHAGTLDPMATGLLVLGVGRGTRLLGHLTLADKQYSATVRLGEATVTDDAEGEVVRRADASHVEPAALARGVRALTGTIDQVPSSVSAVKMGGRRAYARVRSGEQVHLQPRQVTVRRLDVMAVRPAGRCLDVDVEVECTSGTYVRALARDLGDALGVGAHLTRLRRTRVGPYLASRARTLDELAGELRLVPLAEAAAAAFPVVRVDAAAAARLAHGAAIPATGREPGPVAVLDADGALLALVRDVDGAARPVAVFVG